MGGRSKNHGTASTRANQADPEPPKRATRGSKRKATYADESEDNATNGVGDPQSSSEDEQPASQPEAKSPRKLRKTRAQSQSDDNNSLIVKLSLPRSPAGTRTASAEPTVKSRFGQPAKRRRLHTPSNDPSPIEDEEEDPESADAQAPVPDIQINSSTPSSPSSPNSYSVYAPAAAGVSQSRPKWREPALIDFHDSLKGVKKGHYTKLEYDMSIDPSVRDELGAQRQLLSGDVKIDDYDTVIISAPTRGRGTRGRGRGGRGRGKVIHTRDVPDESEFITPVPSRGRGGYRVKKSENPRIQALYHRRAAIRHQYRAIANIQRAALEALAEKSLETLKADPEAHAKLSAFDEVIGKLGEVFEEVMWKADAKLRIVREFLNKKKENDAEYEQMKANCAADQVEDELAAEFYMTVEHILKQWDIRGEGSPGLLKFDDKLGPNAILRINKPKKFVAIEATPYFRPGDFKAQVAPYIPTYGDTETEQHPANFNMIDPQHRESLEENIRHDRLANQPTKKKSKSTKTLLGAAPNPAPMHAQVSEAQELDNDSLMDSDAEPTEGLDKHGVKLPKKQQPKNGAPPNNRFVVERHFDYEEHEIGNRNTKTKRTNTGDAIYMGKDGNPNPKNFHFDQRANGYNSGRNKLIDLIPEQVELYRLHPVYGLPIKGSRNMTFEEYKEEFGDEAAVIVQDVLKPRTDWSQPLTPTRPVIFVEEDDPNDPKGDDRFKKIYRTSRSEHLMRMEQIIAERPGKDKIELMLRELWSEYKEVRHGTLDPDPVESSPSPTPPPSRQVKEKALEIEKASMHNLVAAAVTLKTEEEARLARARLAEKRTRLAFDPVRDISPPPPEPEDRTNLNLLANIASSSRSAIPPPPALAPYHSAYSRPFPPPFPWAVATHAPVSMAHPHGHPLPPPPAHPFHQQQAQQQRGAQAGGSLRQLLPAPPQQGVPPSASPSSSGTIYRY